MIHKRRSFRIGTLSFRVFSSSDPIADRRPPFVLIPGIGMSHRYLARLHDLLSQTGPVYSIDMPGFGGLPKPPESVGVPEMAQALGRVLDLLGIRQAVLFGHSMGTQWAVGLRTDSLGEPVSGNLLVFSDYLRCGQSWFLSQMRHMLAYRIEDRVWDLHAPLLILRGGRDRIVGMGWCRRLRQEAHPAALVTVPGHGHLVQRTAPRAVASAIQAFVSPDT